MQNKAGRIEAKNKKKEKEEKKLKPNIMTSNSDFGSISFDLPKNQSNVIKVIE